MQRSRTASYVVLSFGVAETQRAGRTDEVQMPCRETKFLLSGLRRGVVDESSQTL